MLRHCEISILLISVKSELLAVEGLQRPLQASGHETIVNAAREFGVHSVDELILIEMSNMTARV